MQGINLAEQGHIVNVIPPQDINGGKNGDRFTMKNHGHATIILQIGVTDGAATAIIVRECDAATGGTATDIAFTAYKEETAAGDTLGAKVDVLAAGITPSANDDIMYVIELDGRELADGFPWVELAVTNSSGNSVLASAVAILTGSRYAHSASETALV